MIIYAIFVPDNNTKNKNKMNYFNFKTVEDSIKTLGTIVLVVVLTALVINSFINPSNFVL